MLLRSSKGKNKRLAWKDPSPSLMPCCVFRSMVHWATSKRRIWCSVHVGNICGVLNTSWPTHIPWCILPGETQPLLHISFLIFFSFHFSFSFLFLFLFSFLPGETQPLLHVSSVPGTVMFSGHLASHSPPLCLLLSLNPCNIF